MSLRINTNIPAMTALRNMSTVDDDMSQSITRLSTGLRINSAADDPAGLIISEGLRAQIKGLQQATQNSQDAINMSKTAESAMAEVSTLLNNIRSLAVHAANTAVVDSAQLQADQTQIRSTLQSINRIASETSWGSKKLLNGAAGAVASITQTNLVQSLYIGSDFAGETVRNGSISITRSTQATKATTGALTNTFATANTTVNAGTFVLNGQTFTVPTGATVQNVLDMVNQQADTTNVLASYTAAGGITFTSTKYGSNYGVNYLESSNILNAGVPKPTVTGTDAIYTVSVPVEPSPSTATETFTGGQGPGVDGLTLTSASGNKMVVTEQGNNTAGATLVGALTVGNMRFQIGANADQSASFSLPDVSATNLGTGSIAGKSLADLDLTTQQGASEAIQIIDAAITQVAQTRGELGSFQSNFLQSTVRSLSVAQENMTASESQIRDADIAQEMTEFTRVQILRQSGMSVLAQANQSPQSVLKLLGS